MRIEKFDSFLINETWGTYRGFRDTPNLEDIKDMLKGLSVKKVLEWVPPDRKALHKTEHDLLEKKIKLLKQFGYPESMLKKKFKMVKKDVIVPDEE